MNDTEAAGRVTVVGSHNHDHTVLVERLPTAGETVLGEDFTEGCGGKGSNQAVAAARVGAAAAFVGRLGDDRFAADARSLWNEEGVDHSSVGVDDGARTGVAFVTVDESGENEIVVAPGANAELTDEHVRDADPTADCDVLLTQLEVGDGPVRAGVETAGDAGATVILDPAPPRALPDDVLERVDVATPNRSEARLLAGHDPDADVDDEAVATDLRALGVETVVVTLGADGAMVATGDGVERVPAPAVDPVDTTGAGDAFAGALGASLAAGTDLLDAVRFACAAGAAATTVREVIPSLPTREAVEALLDAARRS